MKQTVMLHFDNEGNCDITPELQGLIAAIKLKNTALLSEFLSYLACFAATKAGVIIYYISQPSHALVKSIESFFTARDTACTQIVYERAKNLSRT